ncbi:hypothetical protein BC941DRAFT_431401 [Chlamydoabsidia padenii]|nr:hypothetical protein BC941DRAFT_431401 [Chlamydoabsidia padenii]
MYNSRLHDSTGKIASPLGKGSSTSFTQSPNRLDQILQEVRQQVISLGMNAKWKIDLTLTEPDHQLPFEQQHQQPNNNSNNNTPSHSNETSSHSLPAFAQTHYPWDDVAPYYDKRHSEPGDDQQQKLITVIQRNKYLEGVVRAQADQIHKMSTLPSDLNNVVKTMKQVYLTSEKEQQVRYIAETRMLHKDIQLLTKRLQRTTHKLHTWESLNANDDPLQDRKRLEQKLYLTQLRLEARDAELDYLRSQSINDTVSTSQLSPRIDLDRLGKLTDQMLSDSPPYQKRSHHSTNNNDGDDDEEEESSSTHYKRPVKHFRINKRSKRTNITMQETLSQPSTVYDDMASRSSVDKRGTRNWDRVGQDVGWSTMPTTMESNLKINPNPLC